MDIDISLQFAEDLAHRSGEIMLRYFDTDMKQWQKEGDQVVTIADEEINQLVIDEVAKVFPAHSVFGEEQSSLKDTEYTWVCDPIDGTVPFSKGMPLSVFSLALCAAGEPVLGVVYDPFTKRLYSAMKGGGATMNGQPLRVNARPLSPRATVDIAWWTGAELDIAAPLHDLSLSTGFYPVHVTSIVQAGCQVARGMYEAAVFAGTEGKSVDIAALKVIVEEAGGRVTDIRGQEQRYDQEIYGAIISNGVVHDQIVQALREVQPQKIIIPSTSV